MAIFSGKDYRELTKSGNYIVTFGGSDSRKMPKQGKNAIESDVNMIRLLVEVGNLKR